MGQTESSLVDCVCDGDIQSLKTLLQQRKQRHEATKSNNNSLEDDNDRSSLAEEIEEAMHAVVGLEIDSAQQFQQLQIALEMLFQTQPHAWASSHGNTIKWTGAHRACVTGNLSFLTFVFQHYDQFDVQERDAFGLFPIDLVPPELLRTPEEMALDAAQEPRVGATKEPIFPATARSRRNLALQILRQKKNEAQARCIDQFLFSEHPSQALVAKSAPLTEKTEPQALENQDPKVGDGTVDKQCPPDDNQEGHHAPAASLQVSAEELVATGAYYIAFESSRDHLVPAMTSSASATVTSMGEVHERSTPLRLKYRFPRLDEFLNGYFQLIWRDGAGQPRSEEPHYDTHVLMRDEMFLDPQGLEFFEGSALNLQEAQASGIVRPLGTPLEVPRRESRCRRLDDANPVLQGCFPFDVSHIPHDAVCHVLFVACDRYLMRRTVVLSTEGIALKDANDDYDFLAPRNFDDEGVDEEEDDSDDEGFVFHVAGEAFSHANPVFSGKNFDGLDDFERFVKELRSKSDQQLRRNQETDEGTVQSEKPDKPGVAVAPASELRESEATCETESRPQEAVSLGEELNVSQPELGEQQEQTDNQGQHEAGEDKEEEAHRTQEED